MSNATLLIGTDEGVYRASIDTIADSRRVLESERVLRVRRFDDA